jgi:hypothetical protein
MLKPATLTTLMEAELALETPAAIAALAQAARRRHEAAVVAVLLYGSCLRGSEVEGVVDLYLLTDGYGPATGNPLARAVNALLPPNVYYLETDFEGQRVRAKYAVVSLAQFQRLVSPQTLETYFWARFAQPARLVWARDQETRAVVAVALARAVETTLGATLPLFAEVPGPDVLWQRALEESYRTELRAERDGRAAEIYAHSAERYDRLAAVWLEQSPGRGGTPAREQAKARRRWRRRRRSGKLRSALRLLKAAFTFSGGASYILWKIERHSGVKQDLTPWQRRHPILTSTVLFWRLYRKGAFR